MGLRIEDRVRKTVVFIGSASHGPFNPIGTGFVAVRFEGDQGFQQVVTCKHVIEMTPGDAIHIRVNRYDGSAQVIETARGHWLPHPDHRIDLMVCPTRIPHDQFDIMHLNMDIPSTLDHRGKNRDQVGIGDDVYIPGLFVSRIGENRNLPILRSGTIAAMPEEKINTQYGEHEAYLIEARSIDGLSGSPVFAFPSMIHLKDGAIGTNPTLSFPLIGMLLGHHQVINPTEVIEISPKGKRGRKPRKIPIPLNTGIGIVLPIAAVIEAIDQESLRMEREKVLQQQKRRGVFVPDAVKPAPNPGENPDHREDFNRLVGAASKSKPKGGRT